MIQDISKRMIFGFVPFALVACSETAQYNGQTVKILGNSCSENPPHSCYKIIELPDGNQVKVASDSLTY